MGHGEVAFRAYPGIIHHLRKAVTFAEIEHCDQGMAYASLYANRLTNVTTMKLVLIIATLIAFIDTFGQSSSPAGRNEFVIDENKQVMLLTYFR